MYRIYRLSGFWILYGGAYSEWLFFNRSEASGYECTRLELQPDADGGFMIIDSIERRVSPAAYYVIAFSRSWYYHGLL